MNKETLGIIIFGLLSVILWVFNVTSFFLWAFIIIFGLLYCYPFFELFFPAFLSEEDLLNL